MREHVKKLVAVDEDAAAVDHLHAIAVAVERDAEVGACFDRPRASSACGCVAPTSRLMLSPSGRAPIASTLRAELANTFGAIWYVAPCAQSSTIETPRRLNDDGTVDLQNSA